MSRKHCHRRVITPMPPRGMRPKLQADQVRDLGICHLVNLDAIRRGTADADTLWQWAGGVLTWWKVAQLLGQGEPEMVQQLDLATRVIERAKTRGRVLFQGPEYQLAKVGVDVMDELAKICDRPTAVIAAEWSEAQLAKLVAQSEQKAAA